MKTKLLPVTQQVLFIIVLALCIMPFVTPPLALFLGLIVAQTIGHPFIHLNHKATQWLLKISVIGLGFWNEPSSCNTSRKRRLDLHTVFNKLSIN